MSDRERCVICHNISMTVANGVCRKCSTAEERIARDKMSEHDEEQLRQHGHLCTWCDTIRPYSWFPISPRTQRILTNEPCTQCQPSTCSRCRKRSAMRDQALCFECRYGGERGQCKKCSQIFSQEELADGKCQKCIDLKVQELMSGVRVSYKVFHCSECRQTYERYEMLEPWRQRCLFCAIKTGRRSDLDAVKRAMEGSAKICNMMEEYIIKNHHLIIKET